MARFKLARDVQTLRSDAGAARRPTAPRGAIALLLAAAVSSAAWASPCERPAEFLKAGAEASARAPLLKPFVVAGVPVLAVRQHAQQAWLELAVDSPASARRLLGSDAVRLESVGGAVLLACNGLDQRLVARAAQPAGATTVALW